MRRRPRRGGAAEDGRTAGQTAAGRGEACVWEQGGNGAGRAGPGGSSAAARGRRRDAEERLAVAGELGRSSTCGAAASGRAEGSWRRGSRRRRRWTAAEARETGDHRGKKGKERQRAARDEAGGRGRQGGGAHGEGVGRGTACRGGARGKEELRCGVGRAAGWEQGEKGERGTSWRSRCLRRDGEAAGKEGKLKEKEDKEKKRIGVRYPKRKRKGSFWEVEGQICETTKMEEGGCKMTGGGKGKRAGGKTLGFGD